MALEKRYNFSIDDLNVVANGYSHFQSYVRHETGNFLSARVISYNFIFRSDNYDPFTYKLVVSVFIFSQLLK